MIRISKWLEQLPFSDRIAKRTSQSCRDAGQTAGQKPYRHIHRAETEVFKTHALILLIKKNYSFVEQNANFEHVCERVSPEPVS